MNFSVSLMAFYKNSQNSFNLNSLTSGTLDSVNYIELIKEQGNKNRCSILPGSQEISGFIGMSEPSRLCSEEYVADTSGGSNHHWVVNEWSNVPVNSQRVLQCKSLSRYSFLCNSSASCSGCLISRPFSVSIKPKMTPFHSPNYCLPSVHKVDTYSHV